jgi:O-antigen/teichoic acid export membrane protein
MTGEQRPRSTARERLAAARTWFVKGGASIADQAMVAGANFVLNILLGRWLEPVQYGAFALAYSLFLLIGTFHTAILTEPMLVFGAGRYAGRFGKYLGLLTVGHVAVLAPIALLLLGVSAALGHLYSAEAQRAMVALALAGPLVLLLWLFRRAFYVIVKPEWALLGAGSYAALLMGGALALKATGRITPGTAFAAMGASALAVSLLLAGRLGLSWAAADEPGAASVAREHWRYARWSMASAALTWIPGNLYFVLLPAWLGLGGTAALRALTNLVLPVVHAIGALSFLLVPLLAERRRAGERAMIRAMRASLALFLSAAGVYEIGLILFRRQIVALLYEGKYAQAVPLAPFVGLLGFLGAVISVRGAALKVREQPDRVFWSYLASSVVAAGSGVLLGRTYGVAGALGGLLLSSATTALIMWLFSRSGRESGA